ncbi:mitochondrial aldehyde dehydrogenase [Ascosphaera aggregata]|nr:mitochondrial aldehyde dehydrogenase [Ascosphaera aggregata]
MLSDSVFGQLGVSRMGFVEGRATSIALNSIHALNPETAVPKTCLRSQRPSKANEHELNQADDWRYVLLEIKLNVLSPLLRASRAMSAKKRHVATSTMPLKASTDVFIEGTAPNGTNDVFEITAVYAAGFEVVDTAAKAGGKTPKEISWWDLSGSEKGRLMNKYQPHSNMLTYTLHKLVGVVGQVIPWNCPILMASWTLGPALATGNTIIMKSAKKTPPRAAIASHPGIKELAFTGSTVIDGAIMKVAAGELKDSINDEFVHKFREIVSKKSVVGNPFEDVTYQRPQVTIVQCGHVLSYISKGVRRTVPKLIPEVCLTRMSMAKASSSSRRSSLVLSPIDNLPGGVFGPFIAIAKFNTQEEAIKMANDRVYGLGAPISTRNRARAQRMAADVESGMVCINSSNDTDYRVPLGGVQQSGIGREFGEAGLEPYTQVKAVHVNLGTVLYD